jgi:hypothetical protein
MIVRMVAFMGFVLGGAITWTEFRFVHAYRHMMAGTGVGPVHAVTSAGALIPWFAYACFVLSALSVLVVRKRAHLWWAASLSHVALVVTFCLLCSEARERGLSELLWEACFSPWILLWGWILSASKGAA